MPHETDMARPDPSASSCDPDLVNLQARSAVDAAGTNGTDGLPLPRRYWASVAIWLAMAMTVIDSSIANVALPTIAQDVGASPAASIWVVNAYQVAIVIGLLPIAALGEILTYRRVYMAGLGLFVVASLGCALAQDLTALAIARVAQGLGAAGVMAVNGALVRFTFPRAMLGRGVGYNALVVALTSAMGPSVASAILAVASWQWLFAVNVPLGLLSLAIGLRCLPRTTPAAEPFDAFAAGLSAVAFATFFLTCSDLARGLGSLRTLAEAALALLAAALLVRRSRGQSRPLLPLDLLRVPVLRLSYLTSASAFGAQMIVLVALPFYLQRALGFGHVETGLLITPMPVGIAIAAPIAGRLVERVPAGLLGGIGLMVLTAAFAALAAAPARQPLAVIMTATLLSGLGFGFFQSPNNRTMLGLAPEGRSGAAAGMLAVARLTGQTSGAVLVALLFRLVGPASNVPMVVAAFIGLLAATFSFSRLRRGISTVSR